MYLVIWWNDEGDCVTTESKNIIHAMDICKAMPVECSPSVIYVLE